MADMLCDHCRVGQETEPSPQDLDRCFVVEMRGGKQVETGGLLLSWQSRFRCCRWLRI